MLRRQLSLLMVLLFLVIFLFFSNDVYGLDKGDLIFHLSFEKGFDADISIGDKYAKVEGNVKLVAGRNGGKAAEFNQRGDLLRFAITNNLNIDQGADQLNLIQISSVRDSEKSWCQ